MAEKEKFYFEVPSSGRKKDSLDYISGIGDKKRTTLLKKFGSVAKIKQASIEEIAEVKGINLELAKKIKEEL